MMKFIKVLLICLLLSGCSIIENRSLDDILSDTSYSKARVNNYSKYVDYYEPSDIHEIESDDISTVFELNNSKIIMNVNISGIINNQYNKDLALADDGFFDIDKLIFNKDSIYYDSDNNEISFFYRLYEYDQVYLMHLANCYINIYGYCEANDLELMTSKIYDLLKSASVDTTAILANYSSRDVIEYHKSTVNLFETVMPIQGRIDDMMIENEETMPQN